MAIITFNHVDFYRGSRPIFKDISLSFPKGKITAILGPSGCGKTTLLHLIGGLIKPQKGNICVFDRKVNQLKRYQLMQLRKQMGVLFQSGALFTQMSVFDNVAFPIRQNTDLSEDLITNIVLMKLEAVGLRNAYQLMPSELSGGMARRVALARAIALDPSLMLYDEPFTGQDPISFHVILKLIKTLNDALSMTSIIVSHDIEEALSIADFVIITANQTIMDTGTPEEIKSSSSSFVQQFLYGNSNGPVSFHYPGESFKHYIECKEKIK
ncbi:ATP-binding cassette domain-containing protein [Thiotrichales bacterium 19S9-12]|nr:ATP-binding cassette domain-containing protein [Thiotrichales bacterium 19S9-11]MCF6811629.1 ATP-binding cassette domain-containing protein [Thiotrichales bacterium 19S9-12]